MVGKNGSGNAPFVGGKPLVCEHPLFLGRDGANVELLRLDGVKGELRVQDGWMWSHDEAAKNDKMFNYHLLTCGRFFCLKCLITSWEQMQFSSPVDFTLDFQHPFLLWKFTPEVAAT